MLCQEPHKFVAEFCLSLFCKRNKTNWKVLGERRTSEVMNKYGQTKTFLRHWLLLLSRKVAFLFYGWTIEILTSRSTTYLLKFFVFPKDVLPFLADTRASPCGRELLLGPHTDGAFSVSAEAVLGCLWNLHGIFFDQAVWFSKRGFHSLRQRNSLKVLWQSKQLSLSTVVHVQARWLHVARGHNV